MTSCWLRAEVAIMTTAVIGQQASVDTVSNWLAEKKL
jgi:hypothetical protein